MEAEARLRSAGQRTASSRSASCSSVKVPTTLVWMNSAGPVDRAVDMALGGEVHHGVRLMLLEQRADRRVASQMSTALEAIARMAVAPAECESRFAA